jgi:hypothetical protein
MRSTQVLVRFCLRMIILAVFATFGSFGFARAIAALLAMSIVFSVVVAIIKRERPLDGILNHWDEALACVALFCLVHTLGDLGLGALAPA